MNPDGVGKPFPGLRAFEPEEDHLFFGRERPTDELLMRLRTARFIAVVGSSGSGKSSLVKSGVIPSLHRGYMVTAGSSWHVVTARPGENPIRNLAKALADVLYAGDDGSLPRAAMAEASLRGSSGGLVDAVAGAHLGANRNVLVLVDQFEELFRFQQSRPAASAREDALAYVSLLLHAASQNDIPVFVCLTMRSEYLGECADYPGLPEAVNRGQFLAPKMNRAELRSAIIGPIAVGGAHISPGLVTRLLNDAGEAADQLPVLQHALMRTWDHWSTRTGGSGELEIRDYEAIGALDGALDRHAEEALEEIPAGARRDLAKRVFQALTEKGEEERGVRRPTSLGELARITGGSLSEVAAVVEPFRQAGRTLLMPPPGVELAEDSIIDLSHEALMRVWMRLAAWVDAEAQSAAVYRRLMEAAELKAAGRTSLWRNPELGIGLQWRAENQPTETWASRYGGRFQEAMNFLSRSRRANLTRMVLLFGVVFAILITAVGWWGYTVEAEKTRLQDELDEFVRENPRFQEETRRLREVNRDLSLKLLAAKEENTYRTAENARLSGEREVLAERKSSFEQEIRELSESIDRAEREIADWRATAERLESEWELENARLDELSRENHTLRERALRAGVLAMERPEMATAGIDVRAAQDSPPTPAGAVEPGGQTTPPNLVDLRELERLRQENQSLKLTIDELQVAEAALRSELEPLERENARLRAANEVLRNSIAELDSEVVRLDGERQALRDKHLALADEASRLKRKCDLIERDIRQAKRLIRDLGFENEVLEKVIEAPPRRWREIPELREGGLIFRGRQP